MARRNQKVQDNFKVDSRSSWRSILYTTLISMIESKFAFLQMQIEGLFGHSSELHKLNFSLPQKVFNTVDVIMIIGKLVVF